MDINNFFKNIKFYLNKRNNNHKLITDIRNMEEFKLDSTDDSDLIDAYFEEMGENIPKYEAKLSIDSDPLFDTSIKIPEPVLADFSILDKEVTELVLMDREVVRGALLQEIEEIKSWPYQKRVAQLQKLFGKIIALEPIYKDDFIANNVHSHELFVDLLSTPGLASIPFVYNFLKYNFQVTKSGKNELKKEMIIKLFDYYYTHSKETVDIFNYILRGTNKVALTLLNIDDYNMEKCFSERILKSFDKEDLAQLFRFYFQNHVEREKLEEFFSEKNKKSLFLISEMTKKVKMITGHGSEFIESAMSLFLNEPNFKILLEDIYNKVIGGEENQDKFSKQLSQTDNFILVHNLINYIVMYRNDKPAIDYHVFLEMSNGKMNSVISKANTMEEFLEYYNQYRINGHKIILGDIGYEKFVKGDFNPIKDFPKVKTKEELVNFKSAYLYNVYGISLEEAEYLKEHYSKYLDKLDGHILEEDLRTLEVLKAINKIYSLDVKSPSFKQEIKMLQTGYYDVIQRKGLNYQSHMASSVIIEGLLNRMYMNTYNERLMKVEDASKIGIDDGVLLIEPEGSFDIILTSFAGAGEFYSDNVNMAEKWNTSALGTFQGLCASHISNSNLGVIDLNAPIIGFASIPKDGLNAMGSSDIYTNPEGYNLRDKNDGRKGENRYFIPGHLMSKETRFGYNEILLDRFLMSDPEGKLKLQPDYVVYYKIKDNIKDDKLYRESLKVAKDFNIPVVVIDVRKIKAREKEELLKLEEKLLESDNVNPDLMMEIVNRYMDNYTGALTMKSFGYEEDFSVSSMRRFFNLVTKKIAKVDNDEQRREWLDALERAYEDEKRKYREAKKVSSYKMSVKSFVLKSFSLEARINELRMNNSSQKEEQVSSVTSYDKPLSLMATYLEKPRRVFYNFNEYTTEKFVIAELFEQLELDGGSSFVDDHIYNSVGDFGVEVTTSPSKDKEMELIENLVISYFFSNCESTCVTDMLKGNPKAEIKFNSYNEDDWNKRLMASSYKNLLDPNSPNYIRLNPEKLDYVLSKIEDMSEKRFIGIFKYVAEDYANKNDAYDSVICTRLLDKKASIRDSFGLLIEQAKALEEGKDPLDINIGKKQ